jgi:LRP1 type putative zinc finger protein
MIEVRRTGEGDPLAFEVVVREGGGETRHRVTLARETGERLTGGKHTPEALLEAAFRFPARPRAEGIDSRPLRRDGDLALLPRIRAGAVALPLALLMTMRPHRSGETAAVRRCAVCCKSRARDPRSHIHSPSID